MLTQPFDVEEVIVYVGSGKTETRRTDHLERDENGQWWRIPWLADGEEMLKTMTGDIVIVNRYAEP